MHEVHLWEQKLYIGLRDLFVGRIFKANPDYESAQAPQTLAKL
jgi:hypothetical protein